MKCAAPFLGIVLSLSLAASSIGQEKPQDKPKFSDFAWMAGTWTGAMGGNTMERTCSMPAGDSIMCMMRVVAGGSVVWLEFSVLRATSGGVVLDTRFFTPDTQPSDPISSELRLKSSSQTELVFDNPSGTEVKSESMTRTGPDTMKGHADLVDEQGKTSAIDSTWQRTH